MTKNSLLTSKPYLKDPATRDALLRQTVISSSAIEGVSRVLAEKALASASDPAAVTTSIQPEKPAEEIIIDRKGAKNAKFKK